MDGKIDIFCEFAFIEKFATICPKSENSLPSKEYKYWQNYLDLICGHNDLVFIDINYEDFVCKCDESLKGQILEEILKAYADVGNLIFLPRESDNMKELDEANEGEIYFNNHDQTIFLLDRSETKCHQMENNYGLIFLCSDNIFKRAEFLFIPQRKEISETTKLWDFAVTYRHPCNSINLIDNYILDKEDNTIEENIKSLFDALMPLELKKRSFGVSILTKESKKNDEEWTKKKRDKVISWIKELRPNYEINVSFSFVSKINMGSNHDRNLITSYYLFDCGYGFVLSDTERLVGTKLTIFPITHTSTLPIIQKLKSIKSH